MLYIVSTPIGNLGDITYRAVETLQNVHLIAAEDTRHTKILCKHYDIETPLTSYYEHNKFRKADELLKKLKSDQDIALVTDAGTPGISDPGFHLIRLAKENDVPVTVVPGATALIAALSLSGFPCHSFAFEGFLPIKSAGRRKKLETFNGEERTHICYESPHRLLKALEDIELVLPDARVAVAREITKKFEEIQEGTATEMLAHFTQSKPRGEFVLLISHPKKGRK